MQETGTNWTPGVRRHFPSTSTAVDLTPRRAKFLPQDEVKDVTGFALIKEEGQTLFRMDVIRVLTEFGSPQPLRVGGYKGGDGEYREFDSKSVRQASSNVSALLDQLERKLAYV